MIKKLKIFAVAMLATGATVAVTNASDTTNIVQPVTVTLQVYQPATIETPPHGDASQTVVKSYPLTSKALIKNILAPSMGTTFSSHASLGYLTDSTLNTNEVVITGITVVPGSTNTTTVTNHSTNISVATAISNVVLSSTNVLIGTLTNGLNGPNTNDIIVGSLTNLTYGSTNISGSFTNTNTVTFSATNVTIVNYTSNSTTFTSNTITIYQPTNELASTNYTPGVLLASTNITETLATTNFTTNVTTIGTNNLETVTVTSSLAGDGATNGTTNVSYVLNAVIPANLLTVIQTNTVIIGSEDTSMAPATNLLTEIGVLTNTFDTNTLVITTNSGTNASAVALTSAAIGTSVVSFATTGTTNTVALGGVNIYTNVGPYTATNSTNFSVSIGGIVVDTNGVVSGGSATSTNSDAPTATSLETVITTVYTTNSSPTSTNAGVTNYTISVSNVVQVVAPITVTNGPAVLTTNISSIVTTTNIVATTYTTNFATNTSETALFVITDGSGATLANTPVPTNIMNVVTLTTGAADVTGETIATTGATNAETDYSVKQLTINGTNGVYFTLEGLVHSTLDNFTVVPAKHGVSAVKMPVTNESWTVVGYGLTNEPGSSNVVIGGTITIGTPAKQVIQ